MKKSVISALGRVFSAEIHGRLPFQSKAKIYRELEIDGLVSPMTRTFGEGPFKITATGRQLTHAGRIAYCMDCAAPPAPRERSEHGTEEQDDGK